VHGSIALHGVMPSCYPEDWHPTRARSLILAKVQGIQWPRGDGRVATVSNEAVAIPIRSSGRLPAAPLRQRAYTNSTFAGSESGGTLSSTSSASCGKHSTSVTGCMHSTSVAGGSCKRKASQVATSESGCMHLTSESSWGGSGGDGASLYRDPAAAAVVSDGLGRSSLVDLLDLMEEHGELSADESAEPAEPDCCPTWRDWGGNSFPHWRDVEADEESAVATAGLDVTAVAAAGRDIWQKWDEQAEHAQFIADGAVLGDQLRATATMLMQEVASIDAETSEPGSVPLPSINSSVSPTIWKLQG
jgi:hypothetical protein